MTNPYLNPCPCEKKSPDCFHSSAGYKQCYTCGSYSVPGLDETATEGLPKIYKDFTFRDEDGQLWLPYFQKTPDNMLFLDGTKPEDAHWVLLPLEGTKPKWDEALKVPYDQFFTAFHRAFTPTPTDEPTEAPAVDPDHSEHGA